MIKIPQTAYTIIFALCFAVTAFFLISISIELKAEKEANNVFKTATLKEIADLKEQDAIRKKEYDVLVNSDTDLKADVEEIRRTKADAKQKKDEDKNNASNATAEHIRSKWAERYKR